MKKVLGIVFAVVLIFGVTSSASAVYFEDFIDTWEVLGIDVDAAPIVQGIPLTYTHDINDDVNLSLYDVTEAWLELDFTNDSSDANGWFIVPFDFREFARFVYDGSAWVELNEVDAGQYTSYIDIGWLNDNGLLDVTIQVYNPLGTAVAWLDHSKLYGCAEAQPAPEPSTMLLLGAGLLGLVAFGRKRMKK